MKVVFVENFTVSLGVAYIFQNLKVAGWQIELLQYHISKFHNIDVYQSPEKYFQMDDICEEILSSKPDIIAFSVFSSNY